MFFFGIPELYLGEGNGTPLQCSCLENPRDGEAWWAAVYGVAQNWTRLKQLSSSRSFIYDPVDIGNLISGFSALSKSSLNIWKFTVQVLLEPGGTEAHSLWLMGPRAQGPQWWSVGLVALRYVGSSWTRNCTCVSCIGRRVLILCATREVLHCVLRNEFVTNI